MIPRKGDSARKRLDQHLVDEGLFPNRSQAQAAVLSGRVLIDEVPHVKPGQSVTPPLNLRLKPSRKYVSRGGFKLEAALDAFSMDPRGLHCLDIGSSTGGFSDCLLQRGARSVTCVDSGTNQLAYSLRTDPRVTVLENSNARSLPDFPLPHPLELVVIDVSFISMLKILPALLKIPLRGLILGLIKPQFEGHPSLVGKGGIVRSPEHQRLILGDFLKGIQSLNLGAEDLIPSPLKGAQGNVEYLIKLNPRNPRLTIPPPQVEKILRLAFK